MLRTMALRFSRDEAASKARDMADNFAGSGSRMGSEIKGRETPSSTLNVCTMGNLCQVKSKKSRATIVIVRLAFKEEGERPSEAREEGRREP